MEALEKGHSVIKELCVLQDELRAECGKMKRVVEPEEEDAGLLEKVREIVVPKLKRLPRFTTKQDNMVRLMRQKLLRSILFVSTKRGLLIGELSLGILVKSKKKFSVA